MNENIRDVKLCLVICVQVTKKPGPGVPVAPSMFVVAVAYVRLRADINILPSPVPRSDLASSTPS